MHAALVDCWLADAGALEVALVTVPPPRMAGAMAEGEIDAFCVGEPWGTVAVEIGAAELILPGAAIWRFAPEKALAMTRRAVEADRERAAALMRAVWRAARWLGAPGNAMTAAELVGGAGHLDVSPEILERALAGRMVIDGHGREVRTPRAIEFFAGAANFPWRSQALWIAETIARKTGADLRRLREAARASFRADLARSGIPRLIRAELLIRNRAATGRFNGAGLVICNPPWNFEATLAALLGGLWPYLADGPGAGRSIDVISGE